MNNLYRYKAKIIRWVDGDTLLCLIDLGFYTHKEERLRLARIDTPELRGSEKEDGKRVKALVTELYPKDTEIHIHSKKKDKYGRFIAEVYHEEKNINQWLIDSGNAKEVHY